MFSDRINGKEIPLRMELLEHIEFVILCALGELAETHADTSICDLGAQSADLVGGPLLQCRGHHDYEYVLEHFNRLIVNIRRFAAHEEGT